MKNTILFVFITLFSAGAFAQTSGTLTVTVTTEDAGGNFKPKNILAFWIGDSSNNFVKTMLAYADKRIQYLYTWKEKTSAAGSQYNRVDAITGATRSSHDTRTCTWNGTNISGEQLQDGTYTINLELTDKHAQGSYSTFTFEKGPNEVTMTPSNVTSFTNISIHWQPSSSSSSSNKEDQIMIYPNPANSIVVINAKNIQSVDIFSFEGKHIGTSNSNNIDIEYLNKGIYFLKILTDKNIVVKKIIKN